MDLPQPVYPWCMEYLWLDLVLLLQLLEKNALTQEQLTVLFIFTTTKKLHTHTLQSFLNMPHTHRARNARIWSHFNTSVRRWFIRRYCRMLTEGCRMHTTWNKQKYNWDHQEQLYSKLSKWWKSTIHELCWQTCRHFHRHS